MYSNPASSAVRATVASSAPSRSGPRGVLKSGICKPIFIVNYLPPSTLSRPAPRPASHPGASHPTRDTAAPRASPSRHLRTRRPTSPTSLTRAVRIERRAVNPAESPGPFGIMILTLPICPVSTGKRRQPTRGRLIVTVRADLIIVGAGLAGAAAAYAAANRGLNVVVLEAFGPAHRNGSSHGSARIFRRAYPDPLYVRLTGQSGRRWRALEAAAGEGLLTLTGAHRLRRRARAGAAAQGADRVRRARRAAARAGGGRALAVHRLRGVGQVMYHEDAGVLDPDRAIAAMLRLAAASGADVRFDTPVEELAAAPGGGAVAATEGETFTAPVAVVAAGAWIAPLLAGLVELPALTVTQQQVFHFAPAPGREARAVAGLHPLRRRRLPLRAARRPRRRGAGRGQDRRARSRPGHHRRRPRLPHRPGRPGPGARVRRRPPARPRPRADERGELPLHLDRERGLHPRPARRRAVRGRVALLGPRREVRPAAGRDHRRPGRGRAPPPTRASPSPRTWP